jgi:hypothetical protein
MNNNKKNGNRYCQECCGKLQKHGSTSTGRQRWYCKKCKTSRIKKRLDLTIKYERLQFSNWLSSKDSQTEVADKLGVSSRTFRRRNAEYWDKTPTIAITGEIYDVIILDAIYVGHMACLILRTLDYVVYWQWASQESEKTWSEVLAKVPEPRVVVSDGHGGILLAIKKIWPNAHVQRCLAHVERNLKQSLGVPKRHSIAYHLMTLWHTIWQVKTLDDSEQWVHEFNTFKNRYYYDIRDFTLTYDRQGHHRRQYRYSGLKAAYSTIEKLLKHDQLFTYVKAGIDNAPRTTNHVEGGINAQIRFQLIYHRGMPLHHQQRMVDWYLFRRTEQYVTWRIPTRGGL